MLLADPGERFLGPADLSGLGEPQEDASEEALAPEGGSTLQGLGLKEYVRAHTERLERAHIQRALSDSSGNVTHAARALGISRKSLQIKMRLYRLRDDEPGSGA